LEASALTRTRLLPRSRHLLAALSDDRLAVVAKDGNEAAFEVIYDRHHRGLLSFCRHMLRSREDAEDALQQTFASAFEALPRTKQPLQLKPWLYTIARNRCLSMLRARREHPVEEVESSSSTAGLSEEVERRAELRELLSDLETLPEPQKAALVLTEVGALGHSEVAKVLECETKQVKSLVFQARSALIEDRRAREIPCAEIREQLATATAGELRRRSLRRHLRQCQGCAEFRGDIRRQRRMLALALPVIPSLGLKESSLAAAGIGGGGAAGGGGLIAALGASSAAKVAAVGVAAGAALGGVAATDPSLVDKAQAAVDRATHGAVSAVFGSSPDRRGPEVSGTKAEGSFGWDAARDAARQKIRSADKAGRGGPSDDKRSPGVGQSRGGGPPGEGDPGKGQANGRDGGKPGKGQANGRDGGKPGKGHAYGRDGGKPGKGHAYGRDQGANRGAKPSGPSRGGVKGAGRRRRNEPGTGRGGQGGGRLPRSLRGGNGHDRPPPKAARPAGRKQERRARVRVR